jgi:uncharacterized membrane protein
MAQTASIRTTPETALGSRSRSVLTILLVAAVFALSWWGVGHTFSEQARMDDTPHYMEYALEVHQGLVPYRDFSVEYPPGALVPFLAPGLFGGIHNFPSYSSHFGVLMLVFGLALAGLVLLMRPGWRALAFVALSPALVGYMMETRFDLWPALLVAGAVAAFLRDRHKLGWFALALAISAKLYAFVLIPLLVVWTLRRRGRGELAKGIAILGATLAASFGPFFALSPGGMWWSVWGQLSRPIQIESLAASLATTFAHPKTIESHNSTSIAGYGWLAGLSTIAEVACLAALWIGFARGRAYEARFVRFAAASVVAFVAFGKVLSPQYLIWLVPLVPLVAGLRGLIVSGLLAVAMIGTQFWVTTGGYGVYIHRFEGAPVVLARNLLLVAILAVLAVPAERLRAWRAGGP